MRLWSLILYTSLVLACDKDSSAPTQPLDTQALLVSVAANVIIPVYQDIEGSASFLNFRVDQFHQTPTDATLRVARGQWDGARRLWDQAQAFRWGPLVTNGYAVTMDGAPVDRLGIEAVLASGVPLSQEFINGLDPSLKGYHAVEYLLFGSSGSKSVADFTPREREYLLHAAQSLDQAANALDSEWYRYYGHALMSAGSAGNTVYPTRAAALPGGAVRRTDRRLARGSPRGAPPRRRTRSSR